MTNELLPCPFCGGSVTLERLPDTRSAMFGVRQWWGIKCRNTANLGGTCAIEQLPSASADAAVERWNRRAPSPVERCGHSKPTKNMDSAGFLRDYLALATRPVVEGGSADLTDELRERVRDAVADALTGVYYCGRVWSAWGVGTMGQDDFTPADQVEEVLDSITDAAIAAIASRPAALAAMEDTQQQQEGCDSALRAEPAGQHDADLRDVIQFALSIADKEDAFAVLGFLQAWNWETDDYLRAAWPEFAEYEAASRCRAEGGATKPESSDIATPSTQQETDNG